MCYFHLPGSRVILLNAFKHSCFLSALGKGLLYKNYIIDLLYGLMMYLIIPEMSVTFLKKENSLS